MARTRPLGFGWFVVGSRVTYFDGMLNHATDKGTVVAASDDRGSYLVRWDNGLADACECPRGAHSADTVRLDCVGEWFGTRDLRPASAE